MFFNLDTKMCICLDILLNMIIVGEATPFFKFITTSRLMTGKELNHMGIRPADIPFQLLSLCSKVGGCQAVDAQERHLMTNLSGISATTGHAPTYVSTPNVNGVFQSGVTWLGLHGRKYLVQGDVSTSWSSARDGCESRGGYLVTVNTPADLAAALAVTLHPDDKYWVGSNDLETEGIFTWHSGERPSIDPSLWNLNQPDNQNNSEHCLVISQGRFNDAPCELSRKYICEILL